ncbi:hypothetical protein Kpol_1053p35, partial [Vanderwaltozyma polyspora DSM 70294]
MSDSEVGKVESSSENDLKRTYYPPAPEGISKRQWKRQCKKLEHERTKDEHNKMKRDKRKKSRENRRLQIQKIVESGKEIPEELKKAPRVNQNQKDSGINIIIDCAFDDLMNDKEVASMDNQITRAYGSNKRENYFANIKITSFNKRLKERFDKLAYNSRYDNWKNFEFIENEDILTNNEDKSKLIYLTADTDEKIDKLEPGITYIVGGIVDKNRYKNLCFEKAQKLGIPAKRLPIDEFVKVAGRKVLTTT